MSQRNAPGNSPRHTKPRSCVVVRIVCLTMMWWVATVPAQAYGTLDGSWYRDFDAIAIGEFVSPSSPVEIVALPSGLNYAKYMFSIKENLKGLNGQQSVTVLVALPPASWNSEVEQLSVQAASLYALILHDRLSTDSARQRHLLEFTRSLKGSPEETLDRFWLALGGTYPFTAPRMKFLREIDKQRCEASHAAIKEEVESTLAELPSRKIAFVSRDDATVGPYAAAARAFIEQWKKLKILNMSVPVATSGPMTIFLQRDVLHEVYVLQKRDGKTPILNENSPLIGKLRRMQDAEDTNASNSAR